MTAKGWSWEGHDFSQLKKVKVPLLEDKKELFVGPSQERGIGWPLYIDENNFLHLPPSFTSKSMTIQYTLCITLRIPGATESAECKLPIHFIIPDISRFTQKLNKKSQNNGGIINVGVATPINDNDNKHEES